MARATVLAIVSTVARLAVVVTVFAGVSVSALTPAKSSLALTVSFGPGSTSLATKDGEAVVGAIDRIRAEDWCTFEVVIVVGHADAAEGVAAAVQALSLARAESVAEVLRKQGIPANKIYVEGKGSSRPMEGRPSARAEIEAVGGVASKACPFSRGPAGLRVSN